MSFGAASFGAASFGTGSPGVPETHAYAPAEPPRHGPPGWAASGSGHADRSGVFDRAGPGDDDAARSPLERAILAEMSFTVGSTNGVDGHRHDRSESRPQASDEVWSGSDSDLLSSTDGLHAVLLSDSAATRGWSARPGRRRRAD